MRSTTSSPSSNNSPSPLETSSSSLAPSAVSNCPGSPRLQFLAGRPNANVPRCEGPRSRPRRKHRQHLRAHGGRWLLTHRACQPARIPLCRPLRPSHPKPRGRPLRHDALHVRHAILPRGLLKGNETLPPAPGEASAQVPNALAAQGEMRLQSDFAVAHAPPVCLLLAELGEQPACDHARLPRRQNSLTSPYRIVEANFLHSCRRWRSSRLLVRTPLRLIDCSEAVPVPVPAVHKPATFPAGTGPQLLQLSCNSPFPSLATDRK